MALIFGDCLSMFPIISITVSAICIGVTVRDLQQIKNPDISHHAIGNSIKGFNTVAQV